MTATHAQTERSTGSFQDALLTRLGHGAVIVDPTALRTYECDGLTGFRVVPCAVVLADTTEDVRKAVQTCREFSVPYVARGAGTGLSGGALPTADGIVISLQRMRRILEVDPQNLRAVVEPGVTNTDITKAAAPFGLHFAPDPSSQQVCTVGGNVAENSGGAHCLKYGFTVHHVLELEAVLPDGTIVRLGGSNREQVGYDLLAAFIGSEGTLGIVTQVVVRLVRNPSTVHTLCADFPSITAASEAVTRIIAAGIVPAAIEMMDALAIEASEAAVGAGYSLDTAAALIVENDGPAAESAAEFKAVEKICRETGTTKIRVAQDAVERAMIWRGRKAAFAAVGRISPDYIVQDGVVPRTRLTEILSRIGEMAAAAGLRVANVFHAGDGNLHPLVLYSEAEGQLERAEDLSREIAELCVEMSGSLSGEHGIGTDKACSMPRMFSESDLSAMWRLRRAFDPDELCNPGKLLPTPRLCGEKPGIYVPHALEVTGGIERF
ncbi:FAD-binding oxidoreductase [Mycolicibacterium frederiksbergense]|uniref:FAD-binding oxidoreductase n=1 Tax=Mycolicibacterium frederiksbergense TaxID=117567 RepID=UPI003999B254